MIVYIIPANTPPYPRDISEEGILQNLQSLVGGPIENCSPVQLLEQGIILLANEEGLLRDLPYNYNLFPFFFVGDLVAVGENAEGFTSLTSRQVAYLERWLHSLRG